MKKYILFSFLSLLVSSFVHAHPVADSVGVEKKDGKRFILHRVDQGQTLYAIARRYGRSVSDIRAANPDVGDAVRYDQVIRVPIPEGALSRKEAKVMDRAIRKEEKKQERDASITSTSVASAPTPKPAERESRKAEDPARAGIHVVEPGQTLYSLAVRYGVAQTDLRKWNNLANNNVLIGQALIVSEKAYVSRMPATPTPPVRTPAPARPDTPARTIENRPRPEPAKPAPRRPDEASSTRPDSRTPTSPTASAKPDEPEPEIPRAGNDAPLPTHGRRVVTSGVAEMIDGSDNSGKFLALHRTAPIGTLVQVRNEFNNQSLWVKVIGRLPNTGVNDKILIKLSAQAFTKLSPNDNRFRAEVNYIVP